jgi:TonB family protein
MLPRASPLGQPAAARHLFSKARALAILSAILPHLTIDLCAFMTLRLPRPALLAALLTLTLTAAAAQAQAPLASRVPGQRCETVPDSVRGPNPRQLAESRQLRAQLVEIGRRNGVTEPQGLLLVDVDSTRKGVLLFMHSNYPEAGVAQVTAAVDKYMESLPSGRGYQALIRVDGEYPAILPGRQHCAPVLLNQQERLDMISQAERTHPARGRLGAPVTRQAVVLLVANREGGVSLAVVARSSGDEYLDRAAEEIGRRLQFAPATLDGVPFDARFRFPVGFQIQ